MCIISGSLFCPHPTPPLTFSVYPYPFSTFLMSSPYEENDLAAANPAKVAELRARIAQLQGNVYNPDRGTHDREMCLTGWGKNKGFLGPWVP